MSKVVENNIDILVEDFIDTFSENFVVSLKKKWIEVTKEQIEKADGRKNINDPICKTAPCIYLAHEKDVVIYVGETSKSIKRRFISDGNGSHKSACAWYSRMTSVKFFVFEEPNLPVMYRKLFEQVLSIHFDPKFYADRKGA